MRSFSVVQIKNKKEEEEQWDNFDLVHIYIYIYLYIYCGAEGFDNLGPFHIKPKTRTEKEEMSKDEQRRSKLLGDVAKDNPVLGESKSRKEKAAHH